MNLKTKPSHSHSNCIKTFVMKDPLYPREPCFHCCILDMLFEMRVITIATFIDS